MELTQLKEQLIMEKHSNELKVKHMMSDMEQTLAALEDTLEKRETAYRVIKSALGEQETTADLTKREPLIMNIVQLHLNAYLQDYS